MFFDSSLEMSGNLSDKVIHSVVTQKISLKSLNL